MNEPATLPWPAPTAIRCAVTVSLVPEAAGGPFVFWDRLEEACVKAAALGVDGLEVFPAAAERLDARELRRLLTTHRLQLAAVGTGAGWVRQKLTLTDANPAIRAQARAFVNAIIDFAGAFGSPAIIGSLQGRAVPPVTRAQALEWLREALEQLGPRAHAHGVPLLFEPLNRYETNLINRIEEGLELLSSLRTRNVRLLADLFHMNIEEPSLPAALRQAGDRLGHVHLADSNRQPAGNGHTDFAAVGRALHAIGYAGFVSAEALPYPTPDEAAQATMAAFRRWFTPEASSPALPSGR
jgi:sugar phosphate isomerase/epimerase